MDYGLVVTHLGCSGVNMLCRACFRRQEANAALFSFLDRLTADHGTIPLRSSSQQAA
jgi:hypothetical protein